MDDAVVEGDDMTRLWDAILKVFRCSDSDQRREHARGVWTVQESEGALRATTRLGGRWKLDVDGRKRPEP